MISATIAWMAVSQKAILTESFCSPVGRPGHDRTPRRARHRCTKHFRTCLGTLSKFAMLFCNLPRNEENRPGLMAQCKLRDTQTFDLADGPKYSHVQRTSSSTQLQALHFLVDNLNETLRKSVKVSKSVPDTMLRPGVTECRRPVNTFSICRTRLTSSEPSRWSCIESI